MKKSRPAAKSKTKKRKPSRRFSEISVITIEDLSSLSLQVSGQTYGTGCDTTHNSGWNCNALSC